MDSTYLLFSLQFHRYLQVHMMFCFRSNADTYSRSHTLASVAHFYVLRCAFRNARLRGCCDRDTRCVTLDDVVTIDKDQRLEYDVKS